MSEPLKILAVSELYPNVEETARGIFVQRCLAEMARLGAEVTVLVPVVWCPPVLRRFERWASYDHTRPLRDVDGVASVVVPYVRPPGLWFNRWSGLSVYLSVLAKAAPFLEKNRFDILYASGFFPCCDAATRLACRLRIPAVGVAIGSDVNIVAVSSQEMQRRFSDVAHRLDGIVARGAALREKIERITGKDALNICGFVDTGVFTPATPDERLSLRRRLALPEERIVLLFAGHLQKAKGIYEAVEALSLVRRKQPEAMLVLCGGGPERKNLETLASPQGLGDSIRVMGEIEPVQMSDWLRASDIFVLPSYSEGMPNAVMEAMSCGLPTITTAVGGIPSAIGACEGAVLVQPKSTSELAEAIERLVKNALLRRKLGLAARGWAERDFSIIKNARHTLEYLERIYSQRLALNDASPGNASHRF